MVNTIKLTIASGSVKLMERTHPDTGLRTVLAGCYIYFNGLDG